MQILNTTITLRSDRSLQDLAGVLSTLLFGGLHFISKDTRLSEERSVLYVSTQILGHEVALCQADEPLLFSLIIQVDNRVLLTVPPSQIRITDAVDISDLISALLSDVEGLEIISPPRDNT
jgi:hypothetical protein